MEWLAQAPSNIALIKYMGKLDHKKNIPSNASLSYTLSNLTTTVILESHQGKKDIWEPLSVTGSDELILSPPAQERFLNHLAYLKSHFKYNGSFIVRSNNNFPHSSGLASSASSFAALTKCAANALSELTSTPLLASEALASLSQHGSGSSCRSFFEPWALWGQDGVHAIDLPYSRLIHQVIVISKAEKGVSSSEAHRRIETSKYYAERPKQAEHHLKLLLSAFIAHDWKSAYEICWREFQDLHQLFSTSEPSFSYINDSSKEALHTLQKFWETHGDGPIVTMDAGPNIHLLYRPEQEEIARRFKHDHLINQYDVL